MCPRQRAIQPSEGHAASGVPPLQLDAPPFAEHGNGVGLQFATRCERSHSARFLEGE